MTWYPSSELLLDPSPPRVADTPSGQLAKSALRGAIQQRRSDPRPFAGRPRLGGRGGFILSAALQAWDLLTQDPQPLANNSLPTGQTVPQQMYLAQVTVEWRVVGSVPPQFVTEVGEPILVFGRLGPIEKFEGPGFVSVGVREIIDEFPDRAPTRLVTGRNGTLFEFFRIVSSSVSPIGDPANPIPTGLPYPIAPGQDQFPELVPITINLPALPGVFPSPVQIPGLIPRPSDLGRRPVPLLFPTTIPRDQREALPPIWYLPEGIQVGTGSRDDIIVVIPGDVTFGEPDLDDDYRSRNPPTTADCVEEPEPPGECCDCEDIRQIVKEELDEKFPPEDLTVLISTTLGAGDSGDFVLPRNTEIVELRILFAPLNVRAQSGGSVGPPVRYNGWYSIGMDGLPSERIPFNYDNVSIPVPPKARSFSFTIIGEGTARAIAKHRITLPIPAP